MGTRPRPSRGASFFLVARTGLAAGAACGALLEVGRGGGQFRGVLGPLGAALGHLRIEPVLDLGVEGDVEGQGPGFVLYVLLCIIQYFSVFFVFFCIFLARSDWV